MSRDTHPHPKKCSSQISKRFEQFFSRTEQIGQTDGRTEAGNENTPFVLMKEGKNQTTIDRRCN